MASSRAIANDIAAQLRRSYFLISELLPEEPAHVLTRNNALSRLQEAIWWLEEMPTSKSDNISLEEVDGYTFR